MSWIWKGREEHTGSMQICVPGCVREAVVGGLVRPVVCVSESK
jgi:hypothetical protein